MRKALKRWSASPRSFVSIRNGPLLAAAVPDGSGTVTKEAQRRFLGAVISRADLWDFNLGNPLKWLRKAGPPFDLQECERRIKVVEFASIIQGSNLAT
jgi:hypothetical protein